MTDKLCEFSWDIIFYDKHYTRIVALGLSFLNDLLNYDSNYIKESRDIDNENEIFKTKFLEKGLVNELEDLKSCNNQEVLEKIQELCITHDFIEGDDEEAEMAVAVNEAVFSRQCIF